MKKILFASIAYLLTLSCIAQEITPKPQMKKWSYGFNLSLNQVFPKFDKSDNGEVNTNLGFGLGGIAVRSLSKSIEFVPKVQIAFYSVDYTFINDISGDVNQGTLDRTQIEVPLHFNKYFNVNSGKRGFYALAVPSFQCNYVKHAPSSIIQSIDLGIGFLKEFSLFKLAPELRYRYTLSNISTHYLYTDFRMHNISLVCNLRK